MARPRFLVFMADNRPLEPNQSRADYNSLAAVINHAYCKKYQYDFTYYRPYLAKGLEDVLNCIDPNTKTLRHAAWSKLLATQKALELKYDFVVYIDSDCIFKDFGVPLTQYTTHANVTFLNNSPYDMTLPCSGFYICRVCSETKLFIDDWYKVNLPQFNKQHAWEQEALWKIYKNYNLAITDSMMFEEQEGQYLRHISSLENAIRIPYFTHFIDSNNLPYQRNIEEISVIEFSTAYGV